MAAGLVGLPLKPISKKSLKCKTSSRLSPHAVCMEEMSLAQKISLCVVREESRHRERRAVVKLPRAREKEREEDTVCSVVHIIFSRDVISEIHTRDTQVSYVTSHSQAKNEYFALQGGHSYSLHCPTVGVPKGHEIVPTAICSRERRCTMQKQLASCPSNPFKGRLVRVGTQPGFSYTIPGDYFGKPTAGSIVQISRLLARKYDFTLNYNVGPAGDFDRKTKSFTNGSHLRVKLSLFRL